MNSIYDKATDAIRERIGKAGSAPAFKEAEISGLPGLHNGPGDA